MNDQLNDPKQELIAKLKEANNILVTVSANPSVDQLAACIGLTVLLNKLKKHATAVFSGTVPSTIDFLKPEDTLEKNTDSLRDFIIALDKSKADKLRYKVEENIVKIFITPYKTSITEQDLDFSQGDFNVDVVLALGVHEQQELDQAITAHGRILHDAVVVSVNTATGSAAELGAINWTVPAASSLSELAVEIVDALAKDLMDSQIATALLTGIVAETERFSNEKTSPETMRLSAELMAAGANQQLVASELQQPEQAPTAADESNGQATSAATPPKSDDGTLEINHPSDEPEPTPVSPNEPKDEPQTPAQQPPQEPEPSKEQSSSAMPLLPPSELSSPHRIVEPPVLGAELTANTKSEDTNAFGGLPQHEPDLPILERNQPAQPTKAEKPDDAPLTTPELVIKPETKEAQSSNEDKAPKLPELELPKPIATPDDNLSVDAVLKPTSSFNDSYQPLASEPAGTPPAVTSTTDGTLADLEQTIHSPHARPSMTGSAPTDQSLDDAREAVLNAINSVPAGDQALPPKADVGATGYLNVHDLPDTADELPPPSTPQQAPATMPSPAPQPPAGLPSFSQPTSQPTPYVPEPTPGNTPADTPLTMPLPPGLSLPPVSATPPASASPGQPAPPPVPPPMTELPPFVNPNQQS